VRSASTRAFRKLDERKKKPPTKEASITAYGRGKMNNMKKVEYIFRVFGEKGEDREVSGKKKKDHHINQKAERKSRTLVETEGLAAQTTATGL